METLRSVLTDTVLACVYLFAIGWLAGAVYFALKEPGGGRVLLRSLALSWPARIAIAAVFLAVVWLTGARAVAGFWRHLTYWEPVLAVAGAVVAIAATALLLWSRWVLGGMWASVPLVQERHRLVTRGPYAIVRHPIYTGLLGLAFGAMLAFGFGGWILFTVLAVPFVLRRVRAEDRMMARTFGAEYDAYRARVPALIPRLGAPTSGPAAPSPSAGSGSCPRRSG